jgi:TPP-dependent 2-oxoacid decarboxylase
MPYTVNSTLVLPLDQIDLRDHFAVARDYALVFLNQLLTNKDLKPIYRTNELNFGFSAQSYARAPNATRGFAPLR